MSLDPTNSLIIPTGEAQVGRVQQPAAPKPTPSDLTEDPSVTPVVEHAIPAPTKTVEAPVQAPAPAATAAPEAVAEVPPPVQAAKPTAAALSERNAALSQAMAKAESGAEPLPAAAPTPVTAKAETAAPALQESAKLSIPVRVNQLQSEQQRLRGELDALERALSKPTMN